MKGPKVEISTGCLAFLCAYGVFDPMGSFWPFVLSVALHEGAHVIVLLLCRREILEIRGSLGGFLIRTAPLSYGRELLTAAAGPVMNGLLFLLTAEKYPVWALVNVVLMAYNLLPFYPLDGGRILRGILALILPPTCAELIERGIRICAFAALTVGAMYMTFFLHSGLWPVMFLGFLFFRVGETAFSHGKTILCNS